MVNVMLEESGPGRPTSSTSQLMIRTFLRRLFKGTTGPLSVGAACPAFSAVDTDGNPVTSQDLLGKRAVLWFFPKADTPG